MGDERMGLHTWKTAFDVEHHAASPGVQAILHATRDIDRTMPPGTQVDSLARSSTIR